jgi:raffinose/stachyose/melibiose transport system substrate-binding protein
LLAAALIASSVLVAVPMLAGASSSKVTLTLWENYGTESNAVAIKAIAKAFTKENPNIAVNVVSEPADNYFPLLQSADVSKSGPDLAVMWTGLYALLYQGMIQPLKGHVSSAALSKMEGLQWMTPGMTGTSDPLVMPLETQFYIGFYNKQLFAKAGITSVPTDWTQLYAACTKLKKIGVTPFAYGNGGQALGAEFYPWYDLSYMMIGDYSVAQWKSLYDGSIPWTSKTTESSLASWQKLETMGCTNPDVLTDTTNIQQFETGQAAMIMDGTWDTAVYTKAMGSKVAAFVPPFSAKPIKGVVDFPGDGISVMNYSKHLADDYKFETFMTTPAAAAIINKAGLIPDLEGTTTSNPVNQQMLNFVTQQHLTVYPMLDNVTQGNVVNAGSSELTTVLANQTTPLAALQKMQQVWGQLPANQRGSAYAG